MDPGLENPVAVAAYAVAAWFLTIPFGIYMGRRRPRSAELLEG